MAKEESIDLTALERASMDIVGMLHDYNPELAQEVQDDLDSVSILLTLLPEELARRDVQWIMCHLLTHILDDTEPSEDDMSAPYVEDAILEYLNALEAMLAKRNVALADPFLKELLDDAIRGIAPSEGGPEPEPEPGDAGDDSDDGETGENEDVPEPEPEK